VKLYRQILPVLLALLLLGSQQFGYAHAVSHLSDSSHRSQKNTQQNKQLPIEQVCDQCLAFAQIGSALTSHALVIFADTSPDSVTLPYPTHILANRTVCVFLSRAPPALA
jgi:hypothetical protein